MPKDPAPKSKFDEYVAKLAADPSKVGILTEGDSWIAFPLPNRPNVVEVLIKKFTGKAAWLRLEDNGDEARIMQAGERESAVVQREAVVEIGDAGAFAFSVNGRPGKALGDKGQVKTLKLTPANAAQYVR